VAFNQQRLAYTENLSPWSGGGCGEAYCRWLSWGWYGLRFLPFLHLWLTLALLTGVRVIADWPLSDNHAYLMSYWCLACGLVLYADRPAAALARIGNHAIHIRLFLNCSMQGARPN